MDNILKPIFVHENDWIAIEISHKCVSRVSIENTALVQVMTWCQTCDNSQAIAWTNVDQYLWRHKVPQGHNDPWHLEC